MPGRYMKRLPHILFILLILLAVSCGSKKKLSSRESERIVYSGQKDVVLTRTQIENARILTDSIGKRVTYEPVDPEKPSRVGNTSFQNATITQEDTDLTREETRSDTTTTDLQDNSREEGDSTTRSRTTDVDDSRWPWWAWFAITGAAVLIAVGWFRFSRR